MELAPTHFDLPHVEHDNPINIEMKPCPNAGSERHPASSDLSEWAILKRMIYPRWSGCGPTLEDLGWVSEPSSSWLVMW